MNGKLTQFVESLSRIVKVAPEDEVLDTIIEALDRKMSNIELKNEPELVLDLQTKIEQFYNLAPGSLNNSFKSKSAHLSEPKLVWVMCCMYFFENDRPKVKRLISNGITKQAIYTYNRKFYDLGTLTHEVTIKENYTKIIQCYE
jgi:hypothetical protein